MSQPNWGKPLGLAVTLFALGGVAYWAEYKHKPEKEAAEEQSKKLVDLKATPVHSLKLTQGARTTALECVDIAAKLCKPGDNSKWVMLEPMKLKADDANANALLSALNNLGSSDTIDLSQETPDKKAALLKEYGLDPAALSSDRKIEIDTDAGATVLYFGTQHPVNDSFFSAVEKVAAGQKPTGKIGDTTVFLTPGYFKSNFEHDLAYWRDKKLLSISSHEVASFDLQTAKGHLSGDRKDGAWTLHEKGQDYAGDIENIDNLISAVTYLNAKGFVSESKSDAAAKAALKGTKPVVTFTLQKEKGSAKDVPAPVKLTLFSGSNKLYATVSDADPLYELDSYAKDRFEKELKDLRLQKLITSMERFGAKRLEVSGAPIGPQPLIFESKDGKWTSASDAKSPARGPVDSEAVSNFLDRLSGNHIKGFLSGAAYPTGEGQGVEIKLGDAKKPVQRDLVFWKSGDKVYAHDLTANRKEALVLDDTLRDGLPWNGDFFNAKAKPSATPSSTRK